jgi:hypothetical protein
MSNNSHGEEEASNIFRALVFQGDAVQFVILTPEGTVIDASWKADADDEDTITQLMETYEPKLFAKLGIGASFIPTGKDEGFTPDKS